jgi:hypothetical protein
MEMLDYSAEINFKSFFSMVKIYMRKLKHISLINIKITVKKYLKNLTVEKYLKILKFKKIQKILAKT